MESLLVDHERRIYMETHAGFTASYDFATVKANANALAGHMGTPSLAIGEEEVGSVAAFEKYLSLVRMATRKFRPGDVWYDPRTPPAARHALESARATRRAVRLHYGNPRTGVDRLAVQDVVGYVGYAAWYLPHPILLTDRQLHIGPRIVELEVVRVVDVLGLIATYEHPTYRLPQLATVGACDPENPERLVLAADGREVLRCSSRAQATRWSKFFRGDIHQPPRQG